MKKITFVIIALVALAGCEKDPELTFKEYYECEKAFTKSADSLRSLYDAGKINLSSYNNKMLTVRGRYDKCIKEGEGSK